MLVVTPADGHLAGLEGLGLLTPHPGKAEAVRESFSAVGFEPLDEEVLSGARIVDVALASAIIGMGPAGHHHTIDALRERVSREFAKRSPPSDPSAAPSREIQLRFRVQQFARP